VKRSGVLNSALAAQLARLGHTHEVVVADCGLPIPAETPSVDLALCPGVPSFLQVLEVLLEELAVEGATAAREIVENNPECWQQLSARLKPVVDVVELVDHTTLKERLGRVRLVVRTGEASPYANVILRCGVPF
jgi:D-ribose pyranase